MQQYRIPLQQVDHAAILCSSALLWHIIWHTSKGSCKNYISTFLGPDSEVGQGCGEEGRLLSTLLLSARWQGLQRWRLLLFSTLSNSSTTTTTFTTNPPPSTPPIQHPHHLQSTTFCTISIVATTTYTAFLFTTTIFIITYTASIFTTTSTPLGLAQNLCPGLWGGEGSLVEWQIWMINCYSIIVPINAYPCALSGVQQI